MRAFLTNLGTLKEKGVNLTIWPQTLQKINWETNITIKPLMGETEKTTRLGRFGEEILRIINYRKKFEDGDKKYAIATVIEGLNYLKETNKI